MLVMIYIILRTNTRGLISKAYGYGCNIRGPICLCGTVNTMILNNNIDSFVEDIHIDRCNINIHKF